MSSMKIKLKNVTAGLLAIAALGLVAMPAMAAAQSIDAGPTADQYTDKTTNFGDRTDPGGGGGPSSGGPSSGGLDDPVGPLPFTGFDVIAMLAVALAVTGLGLALQRAVSREPRHLE